jgi:L-fuconolactonase
MGNAACLSVLQFARLLDCHNILVSPHFVMELHLSLVAAIPNSLFVEYISSLDVVLTEPLRLDDGCFVPVKRRDWEFPLTGISSVSLRWIMRIDSHQHYWKVDRGDYHWMTPQVEVLYRDYLPADLQPSLLEHGIQKTIVVQAAQTRAETDFLLDLAAANDSIAGVVGWLDMDSPGFEQQFEQYRKHIKFVGIRPMLQDIADDEWILRPRVLDSLRLMANADFPFEFLTHPRHLPFVLRVLDQVPGLRAVIDHISKPEIRAGKLEPWKNWIAQASLHKNLYCKLSGMITEADHQHWSVSDLRPYVEHVVECFGPDRVMFGSDWPVCLLAGNYDRMIAALQEILSPMLNAHIERKIFGENAQRFYKLSAEAE